MSLLRCPVVPSTVYIVTSPNDMHVSHFLVGLSISLFLQLLLLIYHLQTSFFFWYIHLHVTVTVPALVFS